MLCQHSPLTLATLFLRTRPDKLLRGLKVIETTLLAKTLSSYVAAYIELKIEGRVFFIVAAP